MIKLGCKRKGLVHCSSGHSVYFPGGDEVVEVQMVCVPDCLKFGAFVLYGQETDLPQDPEPEMPIVLDHAQRRARALALYRDMLKSPEQHRAHFTASGRPSPRYTQKQLGFKVTYQEVEQWWNEARSET